MDKVFKDLVKKVKDSKKFMLVIPDHVKIKPIKDDQIINVVFGSKKLKWVPSSEQCEKLRRFIQLQFNSLEDSNKCKVFVKPIKLKESK